MTNALPGDVVLPVRRRQHDRPRPGELEERALEGLRSYYQRVDAGIMQMLGGLLKGR